MRPHPRRGRARSWIANLITVLASIVAVYLAIELFLFKPALRFLPQPLFHHMIRELQVLGQSSKRALLPKPGYLAILGDSNAQGKGDWFIDVGYDRSAKFHSTHLLQERLGCDVLSFGRSGAGSVDGLVLEPIQTIRMLGRLGLELPRPAIALVYFYEGNDLQNNLFFVDTHYPKAAPRLTDSNPGVFRAFLDRLVADEANGAVRQLRDRPMFGNLLLRLARNTLQNRVTRKYLDVEKLKPAGATNAARVDGRVVSLPDRLQAPPLELDPAQRALGAFVLEQSLLYARDFFAGTRLVVVYLPSPLACYDLVSKNVSVDEENTERKFSTADVALASERLCATIKNFAETNGLGFIDARPALRAAASAAFIHGARDWDHLNKRGYEALSQAIVDALREK